MPPVASAIATQLLFRGRNLGAGYLDFVADRARRFSLDGYAQIEEDETVHVVLRGPEALIDMLEVACMLGPVDCLVERVDARPVPADHLPAGFALRGAA